MLQKFSKAISNSFPDMLLAQKMADLQFISETDLSKLGTDYYLVLYTFYLPFLEFVNDFWYLYVLFRCHRIDPNHLQGMDILAVLLAKERRLKELEQLATRLMAVTEEAPEPWIGKLSQFFTWFKIF